MRVNACTHGAFRLSPGEEELFPTALCWQSVYKYVLRIIYIKFYKYLLATLVNYIYTHTIGGKSGVGIRI